MATHQCAPAHAQLVPRRHVIPFVRDVDDQSSDLGGLSAGLADDGDQVKERTLELLCEIRADDFLALVPR
jgi:hypothetical protein